MELVNMTNEEVLELIETLRLLDKLEKEDPDNEAIDVLSQKVVDAVKGKYLPIAHSHPSATTSKNCPIFNFSALINWLK